MLLLTGATGLVGRALLPRLTSTGRPVRCLVRDPRRLGAQRAHVHVAVGDLGDPSCFRAALRGVTTVVHLGQSVRDQPGAPIEELAGRVTWRLLDAAARAGVERFVLLGALAASGTSRSRFLRAKWLAERTVAASAVPSTIVAPSLVLDRDDRLTARVRRLALLPVVPVTGRGDARFQPIWAGDVAAVIAAVLDAADPPAHVAACGPETLTRDDLVRAVLRAAGRERPLVHVPERVARRALCAARLGPGRPRLTWDEAEVLEVDAVCARGTADAEALGVAPRRVADVLARR